jgi:hypothetical protein
MASMNGKSASPGTLSVLPRSAKVSGTAQSTMPASHTNADCQPKLAMKFWLIGAKTNCPNDEAAWRCRR